MSTEELVAEIETLPKECISQVRDFIIFLRARVEPKNDSGIRAWDLENSLMKSKPLHLGKRTWTRDELYER